MSVTLWSVGATSLKAGVCFLLAAQVLLVIVRARASIVRGEHVLLCIFCAALAAAEIIPSTGFVRAIVLTVASWAGAGFLLRAMRMPWLMPWSAASAAFVGLLVLTAGMGFAGTVPFLSLTAFGLLILSALPLGLLLRLHRKKGTAAALIVFLSGAAWLATGAVDVVLFAAGRNPLHLSSTVVLLLAGCSGWLVFQQGYPQRPGWGGALPAAEPHDIAGALSTRLLASEATLSIQNRLIGSGLLAAGAAHEFKNTLSNVNAAAQHGLSHPDPGGKDECLRLIIDHSQVARDSAVDVLERIAASGDESPCLIDAARDLGRLIRMCQAAFRPLSVAIVSALDPDVMFRARRSDLELVLLNLLRNAADAYRGSAAFGPNLVSIRASSRDGTAMIEVSDSAGGIPDESLYRLFRPGVSRTGGTGIGLYLSRNLVQSNGGTLEYRPTNGGSLFRLTFPAAP